jgi:hypothetical protein
MDPPGQFDIGERAIVLQFVEDAQVDRIEFHDVLQNEFLSAFYAVH